MSNRISISLHSDNFTIEELQAVLVREFSKNPAIHFSLKEEEDEGTRGFDVSNIIIEVWEVIQTLKEVNDVAEALIGKAETDALKEQARKKFQDFLNTLKKSLLKLGTSKGSTLVLNTKKNKILHSSVNKDTPLKLDEDDEIESIQVQDK
jgi:hypothetical protein